MLYSLQIVIVEVILVIHVKKIKDISLLLLIKPDVIVMKFKALLSHMTRLLIIIHNCCFLRHHYFLA